LPFPLPCALVCAASAPLINEAVLAFDAFDAANVWFELLVPVDEGEHHGLSIGAGGVEKGRHLRCIGRPPVKSEGGWAEALQLRSVVLGTEHLFDGGRVRVCQGMAV